MHAMQQAPTLSNVWIRSTRDALHIFYAVALRRCPMVTRRLDAEERRAIAPGHVYVWEERGANSEATGLGMERWTDGMSWGPSRVRDEFLFYHQKDPDVDDDPQDPSTRWALRRRQQPSRPALSTGAATTSPVAPSRSIAPYARGGRGDPSASRRDPLIKQTYSVHVSLPDDRPAGVTRKWHLTAYFSQDSIDTLETVDSIPSISGLVVPEGWFRSARAGNRARRANAASAATAIEAPPMGANGFRQSPMHGYPHHAHPHSPHPRGEHPYAYLHHGRSPSEVYATQGGSFVPIQPHYGASGPYPPSYPAPQPNEHRAYPPPPSVSSSSTLSSSGPAPRYAYREPSDHSQPHSPRSSPSLSTSSRSSDSPFVGAGPLKATTLPPSGAQAQTQTRPRSVAHLNPNPAVSLVPLEQLEKLQAGRAPNGPRVRDAMDEGLINRFKMIR